MVFSAARLGLGLCKSCATGCEAAWPQAPPPSPASAIAPGGQRLSCGRAGSSSRTGWTTGAHLTLPFGVLWCLPFWATLWPATATSSGCCHLPWAPRRKKEKLKPPAQACGNRPTPREERGEEALGIDLGLENVTKGQMGPLIRSGIRGAECVPRAARSREQLSEEASRRCVGPAREESCWALQTWADNEAVSGKSVCFSRTRQCGVGRRVAGRESAEGRSTALSRGTALRTAPHQPRSLRFLYTFANPRLKLLSSHDATSPECEFFLFFF